MKFTPRPKLTGRYHSASRQPRCIWKKKQKNAQNPSF